MKYMRISLLCISLLFITACSEKVNNGELIAVKTTRTKVYHRQDCDLIKDVKYEDLILFNDINETVSGCYRPCRNCEPPDNIEVAKDIYNELLSEYQVMLPDANSHLDECRNMILGQEKAIPSLSDVVANKDINVKEITDSELLFFARENDTSYMTASEYFSFSILEGQIESLEKYLGLDRATY